MVSLIMHIVVLQGSPHIVVQDPRNKQELYIFMTVVSTHVHFLS